MISIRSDRLANGRYGFVVEQYEFIPKINQEVEINNCQFKILGLKIHKPTGHLYILAERIDDASV